KNKKVYEMKLQIDLDRRAGYTAADRQVQFDAAQRVSGMFGRISGLMVRINAARDGALALTEKAQGDAKLSGSLQSFAGKADEIRKKIVATKEGGAVTGEERIREYLDTLYGMLTQYEGKPSDNIIARADELQRQIDAVAKEIDTFVQKDLPGVN